MKRNILLNPGPATTSQEVKEAQVVPDICPREQEFGDLLDGIRADLVRIVHGEADCVAVLFGGSGTAAMEAVVSSVVPPGGRVLVVENGAYGTRFVEIAERHGIDVVSSRIPYGEPPDTNALASLLAINQGITHVFVIHHETTTGMLNPVREIAKVARKHGAAVILDAMSSYAGLPIDLRELPVDYLISSSNKCIQGMAGISFVICRRALLTEANNHSRTYYLDLLEQHRYFEKTRQTRFTPPVQTCYALRRAIDEFFAEGEGGRYARYGHNWELLYRGLASLGFRFLLPREWESGILIAVCEPNHAAYNFNDMHDYLYARGFTIYPGKGAQEATFRLSIIGDLGEEDIGAFLGALSDYLRERGVVL